MGTSGTRPEAPPGPRQTTESMLRKGPTLFGGLSKRSGSGLLLCHQDGRWSDLNALLAMQLGTIAQHSGGGTSGRLEAAFLETDHSRTAVSSCGLFPPKQFFTLW